MDLNSFYCGGFIFFMKHIIRILIFSLLISFALPGSPASAQSETGNEPVWLSARPDTKPSSPVQIIVENIDTHTLDVTLTFSGVWAQQQTGNGKHKVRRFTETGSGWASPPVRDMRQKSRRLPALFH